jgi:hypothetical protein
LIKGRAPSKDQVVAILHLGEEEPVLAARLLAFARFEEGGKIGEPLLPTAQQIVGA